MKTVLRIIQDFTGLPDDEQVYVMGKLFSIREQKPQKHPGLDGPIHPNLAGVDAPDIRSTAETDDAATGQAEQPPI